MVFAQSTGTYCNDMFRLWDHLPLRTLTYVCTLLFLLPCTARGLATGSYRIFKMGSQFHSELEWTRWPTLWSYWFSSNQTPLNSQISILQFIILFTTCIHILASSNCLTFQCNYIACSTCNFYKHFCFKLKGDNTESIQLFDLVPLIFKFKCNYWSHHPIPLLAFPPFPLDRSATASVWLLPFNFIKDGHTRSWRSGNNSSTSTEAWKFSHHNRIAAQW
jgi:hypothetical protein